MSSGMISPAELDSASPASEAITPPLAALMRDIHPGPDLIEQSLDPRVLALLWLLITALLLLLIVLIARRVIRYRRWCRQLEGDPALLVARIQEALRHEALQRWPEARQLAGRGVARLRRSSRRQRFQPVLVSLEQLALWQPEPDSRAVRTASATLSPLGSNPLLPALPPLEA